MKSGKGNNPIRKRHKILLSVLCLLAVSLAQNILSPGAWAALPQTPKAKPAPAAKPAASKAAPSKVAQKQTAASKGKKKKASRIKPQIPSANRYQKNKVFLEFAKNMIADERTHPDYLVLTSDKANKKQVQFRKEGMFMYCDSAHFFEKADSLEAFDNIRMQQGDTLFVYGTYLAYSGTTGIAELFDDVKLINRDVTLTTNCLEYDMNEGYGHYYNFGKIVDKKNTLSSLDGYYFTDSKEAEFYDGVVLDNGKYLMTTDTMFYNTQSHVAEIVAQTVVESDSNVIYTHSGFYNTNTEKAELFDRSLVVGKDGITITGDSLFYDRNEGRGRAIGNMVVTDTVNCSIIDGDYGYHDENTSVTFATGRARAREYSQGDTIYLHGDTLRTFAQYDSIVDSLGVVQKIDTIRVLTAFRKVRFFRSDLQGLCDSMAMSQRDSILNMYYHPVVWSDNRQITGNEINVHFRDSVADWAKLPNFGFMIEHIEDKYYNQLKGKEMIAYFEDKELRQLDVNGNVQMILFPQENDSTYNKFVNAESSFMIVKLKEKQQMEKMTMWPEVSGTVVPLYLARTSQLYLTDFKWYNILRPLDKDDIFYYPPEMQELINAEATKPRRRKTK